MAIIRIKRSSSSGAPTSLLPGELAYSTLTGNLTNGGDRLYFGAGETDNDTSEIDVIGGKYFTDKLDHAPGTLTASSAIIVDANSKIDNLKVDNIDLDGNTVSTTTGDLIFSPTGNVSVSSNRITDVATPTTGTDAANKQYVDNQIGDAVILRIFGDSGEGADITLADSDFTLTGTGGISIAADSGATVVVRLDETGVDSAQYGSTTAIPVLKVNRFGRIDSAGTVNIATTLTVADDVAATQDIDLLTETLTIEGGTGLTSSTGTNKVTLDLDNTAVTPGSYGSGTAIPTFTVDQQGRLTAASTTSISTSLDITDNQGTPNTDTVDLLTDTLTFAASGPTGAFASTVSNNQVTYSIATATTSQIGVASFAPADFDVTSGEVTIASGAISNAQLANNSITILGNEVALGGTIDFDTDSVPEGSTNLYYTNARARQSISVQDAGGDGSLSYNNTTGVITYTGPSASEVRAHFSGGTGVTYTSGTGEIAIGQDVATSANVTFQSIEVGDLTVTGTETIINTVRLSVNDPLIHLADSNESSDDLDIGFIGHYSPDAGATKQHTGIFRDASNGEYYVFATYVDSDLDSTGPTATNLIDRTDPTFGLARFNAATLSGQYLGFDSDLGTKSLDDIAEGSTKLFYTSERADSDARNAISVTSATGLSYTPATGVLAGVTATTSGTKGVAAFNASDFAINSGVVSILALSNAQLDNSSVTIGTDVINLGDTRTDLNGLTSVDVDNLTLDGNTISSTDLNGDIFLTPDGTGKTRVTNLHLDSAGGTKEITEFVEDKVFNMFSNDGDAIDLSYNDTTGVITIAAQKASTSTLGVAQFDDSDFNVDLNGVVTIAEVDGGTY